MASAKYLKKAELYQNCRNFLHLLKWVDEESKSAESCEGQDDGQCSAADW